MANKKKGAIRRAPRSGERRMYGNGKPSHTPQQTKAASASTARVAGAPPRATTPEARPGAAIRPSIARSPAVLAEEYRYVMRDLRRLAILAAATFVVLIALGFVIR